jgi:beta-phosphoglucomutase-like phosphatase (HAD superfamily)
VVTSAIPANAELALRRVGLQNAFNAIITAADVRQGKPHPEGYLKAAAALAAPIKNCIVIEDSVLGLRAGKSAGARLLALATTFPREALAAERPDWLADDFLNLPIELHP